MAQQERPPPLKELDLDGIVRCIALDRLAVAASQVLTEAAVPHVVIKGFTTARWLYNPPRPYTDVDLLVPRQFLRLAVARLQDADVVYSSGNRLGELSHHSVVLRTPLGAELDLHVQLPLVMFRPTSDDLYHQLESHIVLEELDGCMVPVLANPARFVVLALHALGNNDPDDQAAEDLRRACRALDAKAMGQVWALARACGLADLVDGGIAVATAADCRLPSRRVELWRSDRPQAFYLHEMARASPVEVAAYLKREVLPSRAFLIQEEGAGTSRLALLRARIRRWHRLLGQVSRACAHPPRG